MSRFVWFLPVALLIGTGIDCDPVTPPNDLSWYATCGDPVCQGYTGPFAGVAVCTTEAEGEACTTDGAECDPQDDCNTLIRCTDEDPKAQPGGCPISRARFKKDIAYLDDAAVRAASDAVLRTRLATWRYTWEEGEGASHLGFIIDDQPGSAAVQADGEHVDLYGYTSLTVAALQAQHAEIEALRAEVAALRAQVEAAR